MSINACAAKKPGPQVTVAMDGLLASLTFMGITEKADTDVVLKTVLAIVRRNAERRLLGEQS